jgi:uncharacterized phage protein gp47/JayE
MSTTAGITASGFVTPSLQTLLGQIEALQRAAISPSLDMSTDQPLGQLNGIMASVFSDLWNAIAAVYGAVDPNAAEGAQLDNVAALTGTIRPGAKSSVVTATLTFNASTTLSAGAKASVTGHPDQVFVLKNDVFIASAGSVSGTLWTALTTGPIDVQPSTLTVIVTPQSGWTAITNPTEGTLGANSYTDTQLRVLRVEEIQQTGSCNADALRAKLLLVPGIISAQVYENKSDSLVQVTRSGGTATVNRTPHTFEAVIWDGPSPSASNSDIAATLWANDPSGIGSVGATSATTSDEAGVTQTVNFTRAVGKRLYVNVSIVKDPTVAYAGDAAVQAAVANSVSTNQTMPGKELVALSMRAAALAVPGVLDVPSLTLDFAPAPLNTANLFPGYDEVVTLAAADVGFIT